MIDPNAILDGISELFIATDREWRVTYLNRRARQYLHVLGVDGEAVVGEILWEALPFLQGTPFHTAALRALARDSEVETEAQLAPLDRWFVSRIAPTADGVVSYSRDVTARHVAEAAARSNADQLQTLNRNLEERVAELRTLLDVIPVGIGVAMDAEAREIRMNPAFAAMLGVDRTTNPSLTGPNAPQMRYRILRQGREVSATELPIQRAARGATVAGEEIDVVRPDGGRSVLLCHASPVFDSTGAPRGSVAAFLDITQRLREERAQRLLSNASALLNSTLDLEATLSAMAQMAVPGFADSCFVDLFQEGRLERVDLACADPAQREHLLRLARQHPPALPGEDHSVARAVRTGEPVLAREVTDESRARAARDEEHFRFLQAVAADSLISAPLVARGEVLGALTFCFVGSGRRYDEADVAVARELADRAAFAVVNSRLYSAARSELARRARAEADVARWGHIFRHAGWGVAIGSPDASVFEAVNPAYARMHGYEPEELVGRPINMVTAPSCRELIAKNADLARRRGRVAFETRHLTRDGTEFPVLVDLAAVRGEDGTLRCLAANVQDLTERERAEAQVRQAQKMEALGRLAGGVAHDFNNVLMVIIGFADFLSASLDSADPRRSDSEEIRKAAERAAALTRQLLAFGRPRQREPQAVDLNRVVRDMELMLRSVLGEHIQFELHLWPGHIGIEAEQGQLEQVIMNLALNARDAMPDGGRLEIRTNEITFGSDEALRTTGIDLPPGEYYTLSVSDTGHGMDATTRARIFEPFFTTRRSAQNSGLGLAVVYGIVTQNRGHVWVDSTPLRGTRFTICFPRAEQTVVTPAAELAAAVRGGSERLLVVEDEETVRTLTVRVLADAGYSVVAAADGHEALEAIRRDAIDLVVTDVVMPAMSGGDLAARIAVEWPDLPVLFMSGYTGADLAGLGGAEDRFLQKPFAGESLLHKVREVLDARTAVPAPESGHGSQFPQPEE